MLLSFLFPRHVCVRARGDMYVFVVSKCHIGFNLAVIVLLPCFDVDDLSHLNEFLFA